MRIFDFKKVQWDIKYLIAFCTTVLLAIILGIVLFKVSSINIYLYNFTDNYIFYVFSFSNVKLIFSHLLSELFYLYLVFLLVYFTKLKYLSLVIVFIRCLFAVVYSAIMCVTFGFGGILVAVLVFIPLSLVSVVTCWLITESCNLINKKFVFFYPAILAAVNGLLMIILVNILFRFIIMIV